MTERIIGPTWQELWARVDAAVDRHFSGRTEGRPIKVMAAKEHLAGNPSELIVNEAQLRGMKPDDLAGGILQLNAATERTLLDKASIKEKLRSIKDPAQLVAAATNLGLGDL